MCGGQWFTYKRLKVADKWDPSTRGKPIQLLFNVHRSNGFLFCTAAVCINDSRGGGGITFTGNKHACWMLMKQQWRSLRHFEGDLLKHASISSLSFLHLGTISAHCADLAYQGCVIGLCSVWLTFDGILMKRQVSRPVPVSFCPPHSPFVIYLPIVV